MTKRRVTQYIRDPEDGTGVSGVDVAMKRHADNTTVASDTTDANGRADFDHDATGYPGPIYLTATSGGTTRVVSGNVWGQLGGLIWPDDLPDVFQLLGIGVAPGIGSTLNAAATGSDTVITIAPGMAILKDGIPYVQDGSVAVTLDGGSPSNGRIDRIALRLTREEQAQQGVIQYVVIKGTAASDPVPPDLTQDSTTWDLPLYRIAVAQNATTLSSGNITSERPWAFRLPALTPGDILAANGLGQIGVLTAGGEGEVLKIDSGVPIWGLLTGINANAIGDGSVSNTEYGYLDGVTSNLQTQLDGKAASVHTHNATAIGNGDVSNTELSTLDGITSNVQSQLNGKASLSGAAFSGSISTTGNTTLNGSLRDNSANDWTASVLPALGSSYGSQALSGNEYCGRITQTTGVSGTNFGPLWRVNFVNNRANSNYTVFVEGGNRATNQAKLYCSNADNDGFTISATENPGNNTALLVSWFIVDRA